MCYEQLNHEERVEYWRIYLEGLLAFARKVGNDKLFSSGLLYEIDFADTMYRIHLNGDMRLLSVVEDLTLYDSSINETNEKNRNRLRFFNQSSIERGRVYPTEITIGGKARFDRMLANRSKS